jgi:hypothetical protein
VLLTYNSLWRDGRITGADGGRGKTVSKLTTTPGCSLAMIPVVGLMSAMVPSLQHVLSMSPKSAFILETAWQRPPVTSLMSDNIDGPSLTGGASGLLKPGIWSAIVKEN